jgi:hypothetical protein
MDKQWRVVNPLETPSTYKDSRSKGSRGEWEESLRKSTTLYVSLASRFGDSAAEYLIQGRKLELLHHRGTNIRAIF